MFRLFTKVLPRLRPIAVRHIGARAAVRVLAERVSSDRIWYRGGGLSEGDEVIVGLAMGYKTLLVPATVRAGQELELHVRPGEEDEIGAALAVD